MSIAHVHSSKSLCHDGQDLLDIQYCVETSVMTGCVRVCDGQTKITFIQVLKPPENETLVSGKGSEINLS